MYIQRKPTRGQDLAAEERQVRVYLQVPPDVTNKKCTNQPSVPPNLTSTPKLLGQPTPPHYHHCPARRVRKSRTAAKTSPPTPSRSPLLRTPWPGSPYLASRATNEHACVCLFAVLLRQESRATSAPGEVDGRGEREGWVVRRCYGDAANSLWNSKVGKVGESLGVRM